jgi:IS5 family transposase
MRVAEGLARAPRAGFVVVTPIPPMSARCGAVAATAPRSAVLYGHKLNLVTGQSGLILDVVVEAGNPADAERFLPMLERQIARCGVPPRQLAADGGYASQDNLTAAKARGVTDVAFHKKRGLAVEDMVKSRWVYRKLRNFRAGIEAGISQASLRFGTLQLARARSFQDLHLVRGGGAQSGAARPPQTGLASGPDRELR